MSAMLYACSAGSLLFSLFCFVPALGVSALGFPLTLCFTAFLAIATRRFLAAPSRARLGLLRKGLEYLPFVTMTGFVLCRVEADLGKARDVVSALLWTALFALSFIVLFLLSDKRIARRFPALAVPQEPKDSKDRAKGDKGRKPAATPTKRRSPLREAFEWIDALVQAACLVLLINLFIFQLYAIPSESMVPEFMIGDRVVVLKTPSGPKFPLTEAGIPLMRAYDRGDIVVFNNPHYNDTREARVRSFVSQLVYMISFTTVNINRDEFGAIKADPLVKRVTGVAGERLMMVDGVLYSQRTGDDGFAVVEEDKTWATWNLEALPRSDKAYVKDFRVDTELFRRIESIESLRANLDLDAAAAEARALAARFRSLKGMPDLQPAGVDLISKADREVIALYQGNDGVARYLLTTRGGASWFESFMTAWIPSRARGDLFAERSFRLDVLLKLNYGKLIVRNAELMASNASAGAFEADSVRRSLMAEANDLTNYLAAHDQRNMGPFPSAEGSYIPEGHFFLMGDNRFNSLDMRHSYEYRLVPVDPADGWSFLYRSNLDPQAVPVSRILGTASFRFWPPARIGRAR